MTYNVTLSYTHITLLLREGERMNDSIDNRNIVVDLDKANLFVPYHIALMEQEAYTGTEKMVYLALKSFAINSSACYPSQAKIMKRANIKSNSTLSLTLKSLEEKGVITIVPEFDETGRRKSNTYYLSKFDHETGLFITESLEYIKRKKMVADAQAKQLKQGARKGVKKVV